jgi:uncharacterized membrane protein YphA (DoxX/SURF4 family)
LCAQSEALTHTLQLALASLLLLSVVAKVLGTPGSLRHRDRLGVPPWLWRATGIAQAVGVVGLVQER